MALSPTQSHQPSAEAEPFYRTFHRAFFALCLVLGPLCVTVWFGLCPEYGNPACPVGNSATLAAFRAANPLLLQLFFVVTFIATYVYPLTYLLLGRLAMSRSPWLATIGAACGFVGSVVWSLFAGETFWLAAAAHMDVDAPFLVVGRAYVANWPVLVMHGGWVIGHLLGYVLLGIALLRGRVIPRWAAWLFILSPLVMGPIAYGTGLGLLQVLGYGLISIGSVPAALVALKTKYRQAVVSPIEEPTSPTWRVQR